MKKHFLTGLALLLPLTLTFVIVAFFLNLLTDPFVDVVKNLLGYFGIFEKGFWFLSPAQIQQYVSQFLVLVLLFAVTVFLGFITRWVLFHYLIRMGEYVLHRIPLVNTIYKTLQDVVQTIFTNKTRSFKQVVLVPFPSETTFTVGLVTREHLKGVEMEERAAVFVPTTPNPTSGFLMMVKKDDLIFLDMKIEEALKYIISCGVILGEFRQMSPEEVKKHAEEQISAANSQTP